MPWADAGAYARGAAPDPARFFQKKRGKKLCSQSVRFAHGDNFKRGLGRAQDFVPPRISLYAGRFFMGTSSRLDSAERGMGPWSEWSCTARNGPGERSPSTPGGAGPGCGRPWTTPETACTGRRCWGSGASYSWGSWSRRRGGLCCGGSSTAGTSPAWVPSAGGRPAAPSASGRRPGGRRRSRTGSFNPPSSAAAWPPAAGPGGGGRGTD